MAVRARRSTSSSICSTPRCAVPPAARRPPGRSARPARPASCRPPRRSRARTIASCQWVMPRAWSSAWASRRPATSSSAGRLGQQPLDERHRAPPGGRRPGGRPGRARSARRPGRGCRRRCPASCERRRVDPGRVAVAALEVDRPVRDDPVEVGAIAGCRPGSPPSTSRRRRSTARPGGPPRSRRSRPGRHRARAAPSRSQRSRPRPAVTGWTWASPKPGRHRPAAELDDPACAARSTGATDASVPTATIRPSRTASARRERAGGVHGRDAAAAQDEVGRSVAWACGEDDSPVPRGSPPSRPSRRSAASGDRVASPW